MQLKTLLCSILAAAVSLFAAGYKFHDSAHTMGVISAKGGKIQHPPLLDKGRSLYTLIATATVIPPYRGDVRVVLEGSPKMTYAIYNSAPVIDLGVHRRPAFRDHTLYGLQPLDKVALWVVLKPAAGTGNLKGEPTGIGGQTPAQKERCDACNLALAFYDTRTDAAVLKVPIRFREKGGAEHGEHH